jgi:hypothetical protein
VLLVKGEMKQIQQIVKKFGAMCSRPAKVDDGEGFNLRMHLHGLTQAGLDKVLEFLDALAPGVGADRPGAMSEPAPAPTAPITAPAVLPPGLVSLSPETPAPQAAAAPESKPSLPPPTPPAPAFEAPPAPPPAVPASAEDGWWGLQKQPDPRLNWDSIMVGAFNRFAHAATTSVSAAPGTMYNPLFIYGVPGVGKTHMLHAIASALGGSSGEAPIVFTTGAALAGAVSAAVSAGRLAELETRLGPAKALLVDDIHLLSVSDKNQDALIRIFQSFLGRSLQVVLTSVYPPKALASMEDALKISLSSGWSVDMKLPAPAVQEEMIRAFVDRNAIVMAQDEVKRLREQLGPNYCEFPRVAMRWKALSALLRSGVGLPGGGTDIIAGLLSPGERAIQNDMPSDTDLSSALNFVPPAASPDAKKLALFFPKGHNDMMAWAASRFYSVGAMFGLDRTYRHVAMEEYDAGQPFGVPFHIGEACRNCGAQAALVLGPSGEAKLAARVGEFSHAVRHILDSFGVALGWIPFNETGISRPFLAAHLDFTADKP